MDVMGLLSLVRCTVSDSLVSPVLGLCRLFFVALVSPRWSSGCSGLRSSSLLALVGPVVVARCSPRGRLGRSVSPSSSSLELFGRCFVALVLLAGVWAVRFCPRPPCWS